ncbi:MAG: PAS domain-containing protein, partial [Gallionellaceae bacterium]|nr:PAS domain-containing protein [Gallionellaceae bacterium]
MKTDRTKAVDFVQPENMTLNPEFWRGIFDAIDDPVFLHDREFRILLANRAYCQLAGVTEKEAQGKLYWEIFPPGSGPSPGCRAAMRDSGSANSLEEIENGEKTFLSKGYKVPDGQGGVLYSLHALRDISEQKKNETALAESEERLRRAIDTARDAIISIDGESDTIIAWNPAAAAMFGYSRDEALGQVLHQLLAPQRMRSKAMHSVSSFAAEGRGALFGKTIELPALHKDGTEFPIEISL